MQDQAQIAISILMGIIMLGIGVNLRIRDFKRVFLRPRGIMIGLGGQMIILPVLAGMISWLWPMDAAYKVALVLIAACPGGISSNLLTHMNRGRVALSVSLTSLNSLLILFTIPLFINLAHTVFMGEHTIVHLSFWETFRDLFLTAVVPVLAGLTINEFTDGKAAEKVKGFLKYILLALLFLIFIMAIVINRNGTSLDLQQYLPLILPTLLLNVGATFIGYWYAGRGGLENRDRFTIAIEMGLQNNALAIYVATQLMENEKMAQVALVYSSFSFFTTWFITYLLRKKSDAEERSQNL